MEEEKILLESKRIVKEIAGKGFSQKESFAILKGADTIIRQAMCVLVSKQSNTALNEILRAAEDYSKEKVGSLSDSSSLG